MLGLNVREAMFAHRDQPPTHRDASGIEKNQYFQHLLDEEGRVAARCASFWWAGAFIISIGIWALLVLAIP
jgi:hypothetical protein